MEENTSYPKKLTAEEERAFILAYRTRLQDQDKEIFDSMVHWIQDGTMFHAKKWNMFSQKTDVPYPQKGDRVFRGRRSGNTTRLIDAAIQTLFDTGRVTWVDHAHREGNHANASGFDRLLDRLDNEHGITRANATVDRGTFTIIFKKPGGVSPVD